jgi:hypothetical protein
MSQFLTWLNSRCYEASVYSHVSWNYRNALRMLLPDMMIPLEFYYSIIFSYPGIVFTYAHQSAGCSVAKCTFRHKCKLADGFIQWWEGECADVVLERAWLYYPKLMAWRNEHVILTVTKLNLYILPPPPPHHQIRFIGSEHFKITL